MIIIIHGVTGSDNHSAVVGAVEAQSPMAVRDAMKKYFQSYGRGQLNRQRFAELVTFSGLKIVPIASIDYDQV
jgi:hypothetical protein